MFADPDAGRSVARYLGLTMEETGEPRPGAAAVHGTAPAPPALRQADGSVAMGALLGLADSVGGLCSGLAALPGWVVSTNLMLRAVGLDAVGPLALDADVLRVGRNAVVASVLITDAGARGKLLADGRLTSSILAPEGGPPPWDRPVRMAITPIDPGAAPPLPEFLGVRYEREDRVTMDVTDALRNPWGILHGAVTAALVDLAALHATGGSATTDVVMHFVSPARVGPVAATVTRIGSRPDGVLVRVELRDQGRDDRLVAFAVATVAP